MQLNRKGVALGLVVGLIGGAAGGALATTGGTTATTTTQTTTTASAPGQALVQAFLADVAKRLGVSVDQLTAALKGAAGDQIDQAVADGRLTQAQADKLKQAIQSGKLPGPGLHLGLPGFGHKGPGPGFGFGFGFGIAGADLMQTAATYLGTTPAQLRSDLAGGKSLADVATAAGKTAAGLEDALLAAATKAIDANTKLSDAQKTKIESNLKAVIDAIVTRSVKERPLGGMFRGAQRGGAVHPQGTVTFR